MLSQFAKRLLMIEAESFDPAQSEDIQGYVPSEKVLSKFCFEILNLYRESLPGVTCGWISVAGLKPGCLVPVATLPDILMDRIPNLDRKEAQGLAEGKPADVICARDHPYLNGLNEDIAEALVVKLIGFDEYYGVMVICAETSGCFNDEKVGEVVRTLPLLNRLMAEANFSMRLAVLAAPFDFQDGVANKQQIYRHMVRQACRGLAADGAVIRVCSANDKALVRGGLAVSERYGLVTDEQLAANDAGERICEQVFLSTEGIAIQSMKVDGTRISIGARIAEDDDRRLKEHGVQAYMLIRLESELSISGKPVPLGIMSIFHRFPQVFSRRDVSLFRGICKRMSDDLVLLEQRDEHEEILRLLQAQNNLGNRAEITALLGHDFGHRVFHVSSDLRTFIDHERRQWRDKGLPKSFDADAAKLTKSCNELEQIVLQLRQLGQGTEEPPNWFNVHDTRIDKSAVLGAFGEVEKTLATVLERNRMALEYKTEGNCAVFGVRGVFLQALYNLVVNAIDAQKGAGKNKHNVIHLTCREVGEGQHRKVEINVWDDGQGISRTAFPDAQKIFDVGTSSKPTGTLGTGTGLPVARRLLGRYFKADLALIDRTKALFHFSIPSPLDRK